MSAAVQPGHPSATLATVFAAWKLFLLAIAAGSQVGPTYDTSSSLLAPDAAGAGAGAGGALQGLVTRLTSWDAVYFVKSAQRGYLFEQEWAFSSALPKCISLIIRGERPAAVHFTTHTPPPRAPQRPSASQIPELLTNESSPSPASLGCQPYRCRTPDRRHILQHMPSSISPGALSAGVTGLE